MRKRRLQDRSHSQRVGRYTACIAAAVTIGPTDRGDRFVGKFILGFIVAIVLVLFIVARCVGAIV